MSDFQESDIEEPVCAKHPLDLSELHLEALSMQDSRPLTEFKAKKFKENAQKHWDLFYKRNEDRFFKVRIFFTLDYFHRLDSFSLFLMYFHSMTTHFQSDIRYLTEGNAS